MLVANGAYAVLDPINWLMSPTNNFGLFVAFAVLAYIANLVGLMCLTQTFCELVDIQLKFEATRHSSLTQSSSSERRLVGSSGIDDQTELTS
jgi:hypothetical protein